MKTSTNKLPALPLSIALVALVCLVLGLVIPSDLAMRRPDTIRKGPGVTEVRHLSDWFPGIKGTSGDTDVYVLDSGKPGGSALVLGGTHPNEPAGFMTAIILVENARPEAGKLFVIPHANASGSTHTDYMEGEPRHFTIQGASGPRSFRFGSRATSPADQWPDPDIYIHASSGQRLSGSETRNLNRAYPGRADGTFTEKVAFAITSLIKVEKIDVTVDLHEASPEYPVINAIVAHERAMKVASVAVLNLEFDGITMGLEPSPVNLHGLSHRELGDATNTLALLMEAANPSQGRLRGVTDEALILKGRDPLYVRAKALGRLFVPYDEKGWPLEVRVGRHMAGLAAIFAAWSEGRPDSPIISGGLPSYDDIVAEGLGKLL
ncbi:MAG: succinylglutamate desuccinylase [Spirochaetota bacterium]